MTAEPPPGWYEAPDSPPNLRYWDGELWSANTRPAHFTGQPTPQVLKSEAVADALEDGETIEAGFSTRMARATFYVATDRRVLILEPSGLRDYQVIDLPYEAIKKLKTSDGTMEIKAEGYSAVDISLESKPVENFGSYVNHRMAAAKKASLAELPPPTAFGNRSDRPSFDPAEPPRSGGAPSESSLVDDLARLATLHADCALTDDEFAAAKAQLLNP